MTFAEEQQLRRSLARIQADALSRGFWRGLYVGAFLGSFSVNLYLWVFH